MASGQPSAGDSFASSNREACRVVGKREGIDQPMLRRRVATGLSVSFWSGCHTRLCVVFGQQIVLDDRDVILGGCSRSREHRLSTVVSWKCVATWDVNGHAVSVRQRPCVTSVAVARVQKQTYNTVTQLALTSDLGADISASHDGDQSGTNLSSWFKAVWIIVAGTNISSSAPYSRCSGRVVPIECVDAGRSSGGWRWQQR